MDETIFQRFGSEGLIKTVDEPAENLDSERKAQLNRRGNVLFNQGDVETARRIFQTTGYSDGLIRVGQHYMEHKRPVDALKMFKLSHDQAKSDELIAQAALAVRNMLLGDAPGNNDEHDEPVRKQPPV
ncbi:MAG TPA: hypothetical protein PLC54_00500 [Spirochaetales bacterium]|nr:hypothetical protein [Spirochaetales bacterium]